MAITFQKLGIHGYLPAQARNIAYLQPDNWDDFGYKTLFTLTVFDEQGNKLEIGSVKIGIIAQDVARTADKIPQQFDVLPDNFYSLGQDADYYQNIINRLSENTAFYILNSLGDVVLDQDRLAIADHEDAFNTSLMRTVNRSTIEQQFRRILRHEATLTNYDFFYEKEPNENYSGIKVEFQVKPNMKPSSNIHILIGRNGVGKTIYGY